MIFSLILKILVSFETLVSYEQIILKLKYCLRIRLNEYKGKTQHGDKRKLAYYTIDVL